MLNSIKNPTFNIVFNPKTDFKTGGQDGEILQKRLWLLFDIAQIISNASHHKQIILCVLCALCG
jgi:hypothetical protein